MKKGGRLHVDREGGKPTPLVLKQICFVVFLFVCFWLITERSARHTVDPKSVTNDTLKGRVVEIPSQADSQAIRRLLGQKPKCDKNKPNEKIQKSDSRNISGLRVTTRVYNENAVNWMLFTCYKRGLGCPMNRAMKVATHNGTWLMWTTDHISEPFPECWLTFSSCL